MKIWLDDVRPMPKEFDIWYKRGEHLIEHIEQGKPITCISFDHDLSFKHYFGLNPFNKMTGYDVAKEIEKLAYEGKIKRFDWAVHSANPVGADRIRQAMTNASKYWSMHETGSSKEENN